MFLSNFHFLGFAKKGHFQAVKFFLTDGPTDRPTDRPTNLLIEAHCQSLKVARLRLSCDSYFTITESN